jgi:putative exosortase-associated protein (TIGR04073 family)
MTGRVRTRWLIGVLIVCFSVVVVVESFAAGPQYEYSFATKVSRKFLRGVGNIAFGWVEIPRQMNTDIQNTDPFTGTFTGIYKGVQRTVLRGIVGVWEVVSFPVPVPSNYAPIVEPEFVYGKDIE